MYHHLEGINYLEGLYLSVITFTTVGYGDLSPKDDRGRIFSCLFVFLALMGIAQLLDILVDYIMEQRKLIEQSQIYKHWFESEDDSEEERNGNGFPPALQDDSLVPDPDIEDRWELFYSFTNSMSYILLVILFGAIFYSLIVDNYNLVESFYLSTMTVTTVGYGDIVPTNDISRAFTGFYAIFGTVAFGRAVSLFISTLGEQRDRRKHQKLLSASALDIETWKTANVDGSDDVSKVEFVYMRLLQMDMIDPGLRAKIEEQFDRMDRDKDGNLTIHDIMLAQQEHVEKMKNKNNILKRGKTTMM